MIKILQISALPSPPCNPPRAMRGDRIRNSSVNDASLRCLLDLNVVTRCTLEKMIESPVSKVERNTITLVVGESRLEVRSRSRRNCPTPIPIDKNLEFWTDIPTIAFTFSIVFD